MSYVVQMRMEKTALAGVALGTLALIMHRSLSASALEVWYGNGVFRICRVMLDYTFGLLPLPGTFLLVLVLVIFLARRLRGWRKWKLGTFVLKFMGAIGWILFSFYALWGFNYGRASVSERLSWSKDKLDKKTLIEMAEHFLVDLNEIRGNLNVEDHFGETRSWQQKIRFDAYPLARQLGYQVPGRKLRSREWKPVGILLRIGTAGFYNPLTGECNIDGGLHDLQKPYVIAHEYFHGLGVTGEGDCNFLAYLLCHHSSDPFIRYSGELGFWRYLRSALYRNSPEDFKLVMQKSLPQIQEDIRAIDAQMDKFPDIAPRVRDKMYDTYLKSNKIEDGMASYGTVVGMVLNWKRNGEQL